MNTLWMIGIVFLSVGNLRSAVVLGEDSTAAPAITPIGGVWRGYAPLRDSKIGEKDMAEMAYGMGWVSCARAQICLLTWVAWHRSLRAVPCRNFCTLCEAEPEGVGVPWGRYRGARTRVSFLFGVGGKLPMFSNDVALCFLAKALFVLSSCVSARNAFFMRSPH
jgi:hypothetical protein